MVMKRRIRSRFWPIEDWRGVLLEGREEVDDTKSGEEYPPCHPLGAELYLGHKEVDQLPTLGKIRSHIPPSPSLQTWTLIMILSFSSGMSSRCPWTTCSWDTSTGTWPWPWSRCRWRPWMETVKEVVAKQSRVYEDPRVNHVPESPGQKFLYPASAAETCSQGGRWRSYQGLWWKVARNLCWKHSLPSPAWCRSWNEVHNADGRDEEGQDGGGHDEAQLNQVFLHWWRKNSSPSSMIIKRRSRSRPELPWRGCTSLTWVLSRPASSIAKDLFLY